MPGGEDGKVWISEKHGTSIHMAHGVYVRTSHWSLGGVVAYVAKTTWCIIMLQQDLHLGLQDMNISLWVIYVISLAVDGLSTGQPVGSWENKPFIEWIIHDIHHIKWCRVLSINLISEGYLKWSLLNIPTYPYIILASMSSCEIAPNRCEKDHRIWFQGFWRIHVQLL